MTDTTPTLLQAVNAFMARATPYLRAHLPVDPALREAGARLAEVMAAQRTGPAFCANCDDERIVREGLRAALVQANDGLEALLAAYVRRVEGTGLWTATDEEDETAAERVQEQIAAALSADLPARGPAGSAADTGPWGPWSFVQEVYGAIEDARPMMGGARIAAGREGDTRTADEWLRTIRRLVAVRDAAVVRGAETGRDADVVGEHIPPPSRVGELTAALDADLLDAYSPQEERPHAASPQTGNTCPDCGGLLRHTEGCERCFQCGYTRC